MARLNLCIRNNRLAVDTETTGLNPWRPQARWGVAPDRPFAFSFCDSDGNYDYVRWEVSKKDRTVKPDPKTLKQVREVMADPRIEKVFHNISFDHRMSEMSGIKVAGELHDTIFLMHVLTGGGERNYGLKPLAEKFLDIPQDDQTELKKSVHAARRQGRKEGWAIAKEETHGKEPVYADFWLGDEELCRDYAINDAQRTMLLFQNAYPQVMADKELARVYQRELNLFWVVKKMEERGCRVHPEDVKRLKKFYTDYMDQQMRLVHKHGGKGLNFNSPPQMQKMFYQKLGYEPKYHRKTGNVTLDSKALASIAKKGDKLARAILEWKAGDHMLSAFLNPYERFMVKEGPNEYVLHGRFKQCGPVTGRFSCTDPNLMNVASEDTGDRKTEIALKPRECLGPREGHVWYMPDWSQIEVWIFAFLAKDPTMMDALLKGKDFHETNAEKVWGKKPDYLEKKKIYRKRAKGLFFGRLYGGGKKTAAESLECTLLEASAYIAEFEEQLPGVKEFTEKVVSEIERNGEIRNAFGRLYKIQPDYAYKGVNYIVQGTAADIAKRAMIRIQRVLDEQCPGGSIILMLHDEFAIEVPKKLSSKELMRAIIRAMQADSRRLGIPVDVPVDIDLVESRWSSATELCRDHLNDKKKCTSGKCGDEKRGKDGK